MFKCKQKNITCIQKNKIEITNEKYWLRLVISFLN